MCLCSFTIRVILQIYYKNIKVIYKYNLFLKLVKLVDLVHRRQSSQLVRLLIYLVDKYVFFLVLCNLDKKKK